MADYLADLLCERLEHFGDWLVGKLNSTMKLEFFTVKSSICPIKSFTHEELLLLRHGKRSQGYNGLK